ncbi:hypothetical protein EJ06DRAFT_526149 [Trichodelitschia bisporula]|uniref:Uncharacterized protein n=1 Tax=Trichodelitschia bisporula TaxID=703511 RepID=A0A6G1IC43_9PEZI|nr:hypothetical protein EJ06DRAFT_526149 [Trichodelitschia bisporula]
MGPVLCEKAIGGSCRTQVLQPSLMHFVQNPDLIDATYKQIQYRNQSALAMRTHNLKALRHSMYTEHVDDHAVRKPDLKPAVVRHAQEQPKRRRTRPRPILLNTGDGLGHFDPAS